MAKSLCPHVNSIGDFTHDDVLSKQFCEICGEKGPNLWICISKECELFTACGEGAKDHSTAHYKSHPTHRLTLNSTTLRVWCYSCECEVFVESNCPNHDEKKMARNPILANQVYIADASDEDTTDEEDELVGNIFTVNYLS